MPTSQSARLRPIAAAASASSSRPSFNLRKSAPHRLELRSGLLQHHQQPFPRQHRQLAPAPPLPLRADLMGLRQADQVPDRPGDQVPASAQVSVLAVVGAQDASNVPRDRRLLCDTGVTHLRGGLDFGAKSAGSGTAGTVSSPIFACSSRIRSRSAAPSTAPAPKIPAACSSSYSFQLVIWFT